MAAGIKRVMSPHAYQAFAGVSSTTVAVTYDIVRHRIVLIVPDAAAATVTQNPVALVGLSTGIV